MTGSRAARLAAGMTLAEAAKLLLLSPSRLAHLESGGGWSLFRAEMAVWLYRRRGAVCRVDDFLHGRRTPLPRARGPRGVTRLK